MTTFSASSGKLLFLPTSRTSSEANKMPGTLQATLGLIQGVFLKNHSWCHIWLRKIPIITLLCFFNVISYLEWHVVKH